jgi:hypothetical protein
MNQQVTDYIQKLSEKPNQAWQIEVCNQIRQIVHQAIPDIEERIQYGKPHFLKQGKYAGVLGTAKAWVTFTIFNAQTLEAPEGFFEADGSPERKTIKVRDGQTVDYNLLAALIKQAAAAQ